MGERITISFEMEKEVVLAMYANDVIAKAFDEFLKETFSSFWQIHAKTIKHNLEVIKQERTEEEIERIVLQYMKTLIATQDMEAMQIAAVREMFTEGFTNRKKLDEAVKNAFQAVPVMLIAEKIRSDLRNQYLFAKTS